MATTMKAAVLRAFGEPLGLEDVAVPHPRAGEVVVRVAASGVCHTDLHAVDGDWAAKPQLPFVPGHEGAGEVVSCGEGVGTLEPGDRVGVWWLHRTCGECEYCLSGWESLCPAQINTGYAVNGCYAQYVVAQAAFVARLPEGLELVQAAPILCAGVTTYKGLRETGARAGDWVAIVGIGGLGHIAVQYAKAMGLRVAAVDVADDKVELARAKGADLAINANTSDAVKTVRREIGGAHAALVTAASHAAFAQAVRMLRRGGTCVLNGLPPGDVPASIMEVVLKGLTIRGSIVGTRKDMREALQFAAEGKVRVAVEEAPLEAVNTVLERLRRGGVSGRAVLRA